MTGILEHDVNHPSLEVVRANTLNELLHDCLKNVM